MKMAEKQTILILLLLRIIYLVTGETGRSSFKINPRERGYHPQKENSPSSSRKFKLGVPYFPKFIFGLEPNPIFVKISKTIHPFGSTDLKLSVDYDVGRSLWEFKSSLEDVVIGAKLVLSQRELQAEKYFQFSLGPVEELVMRLRASAAIDFHTRRAYAKLGFRTDLSPLSSMEGLTLCKRLPLDGPEGSAKIEIKAHITAPKIYVEYSNDKENFQYKDIEINIEQANLLLDF
mmetsp:Transcript_1262/g.1922  ORF Transcript_1262/g.1922 Transcript_1262/m.1922 type:complete len:233 (-) Transcript_1262:1942-2640(-)